MDLRNSNHTPFSLQEKRCGVLSPTVSEVLSSTLETKSSAAGLKSCIKNAVVIFCDLSGFQQLSVRYGDITCARLVDSLFSEFDVLAADLHLSPLKTNGDQYIAVSFSGEHSSTTHSLLNTLVNAIEFAFRARELVNSNDLLASSSSQLRVGIATGSLLAGQSSRPLAGFDIWGTTVNRAAMLEQYTAPNTIAICEKSYSLVKRQIIHRSSASANNTCSFNTYFTCGSNINANTELSTREHDKRKLSESKMCGENCKETTFLPKQLHTKTMLMSAYVC